MKHVDKKTDVAPLDPVEFEIIRLKNFFGTMNADKKCKAYATRLVSKGFYEYEIKKAVDHWIDNKTSFPNFSEFCYCVSGFKPKNAKSNESHQCSKKVCDGSQWLDLVEVNGRKDIIRCARCICHPQQTKANFDTQMLVYQIPKEMKERYDRHNQVDKQENLVRGSPP